MKIFGIQIGKRKSIPIQIDSSSQPYVLRRRMEEAHMTHDQTVIADIPNVQVRNEKGVPSLYFCTAGRLLIQEKITPGDGHPIPNDIALENISIDEGFKTGYYDLKNIKLYSNGSMQVIATAKTKFERVKA